MLYKGKKYETRERKPMGCVWAGKRGRRAGMGKIVNPETRLWQRDKEATVRLILTTVSSDEGLNLLLSSVLAGWRGGGEPQTHEVDLPRGLMLRRPHTP